jgi:hypothetical protein
MKDYKQKYEEALERAKEINNEQRAQPFNIMTKVFPELKESMATIKAFTNLQQSKKLAEILPLESADMWWLYVTAQGKHIAMMYEEPDPHYIARMESYGIKDAAIRCWSLGALLDVLPNYQLQTQDDGIGILCSCNGNFNIVTADNPVDACVAMIDKLHELKML